MRYRLIAILLEVCLYTPLELHEVEAYSNPTRGLYTPLELREVESSRQ